MKKSLGRRLVRRTPSPSMVVACLALAVALSGAGYAAVTLPRNSVGTPQLKRNAVVSTKIAAGGVGTSDLKANAVKGSKVAANTLQGVDISEATLGQVPSAANAGKLDGFDANGLVRSAGGTFTTDVPLTSTADGHLLITVDITAPSAGLLMVVANMTLNSTAGGGVGRCGLDLDAPTGTAWSADTVMNRTYMEVNNEPQNCATNQRYAVSAGAHTVRLKANLSQGDVTAQGGSMWVLYVPFGGVG